MYTNPFMLTWGNLSQYLIIDYIVLFHTNISYLLECSVPLLSILLKALGGDYSLKRSWLECHKLGTLGCGMSYNSNVPRFFPEMFSQVWVDARTGPLKDIQICCKVSPVLFWLVASFRSGRWTCTPPIWGPECSRAGFPHRCLCILIYSSLPWFSLLNISP